MRRRACSIGPAVPRRDENLARICCDRGHHRRADRVHDVVAVPLDQRHHRGQPLQDLALARALDGLDQAAPPDRPADGVRRGPQPPQDRGRVQVRGQQELGHLLLHVGPEPGHGGELGPVGLLVQADPAPEVAAGPRPAPARP